MSAENDTMVQSVQSASSDAQLKMINAREASKVASKGQDTTMLLWEPQEEHRLAA